MITPQEYFNNKIVSLVCNGSSLLNNDYGEKIDSADIVIRLNVGATKTQGYEKHVGSRMDVFAMNGWRHHADVKIIDEFFKNLSKNDKVLFTRPLHGLNISIDNYYINEINRIGCDFFEVKKEHVFFNKTEHYSSGLSVILFLNAFNAKLNVYGLDFLQGGYFYLNKAVFSSHSSKREKDAIDKLLQDGSNIESFH